MTKSQPLILSILSVDCVLSLSPFELRSAVDIQLFARAKRCRINLCKRHRFVYRYLQIASAEYDDVTDDVINANPSADSPARHRFIFFASLHLLILIANAKSCRSNLFTRHRFAIANTNCWLKLSADFIPL
ncbi:ly 5'-AMP-activated protein kinase beta-1 subunit-related [Dorcoceras hygrometricum]|uniref:Ly 5'-AMP-activated protein kinase beta-1 subunit-related n=1 Tax=Dorcoceras hygrometricum TaxID=472368 RepID=A0A2Z7CC43_9LAMI|nr:ly 5'-AMP-activated protein kinase beta-1 subunit-related [Dorcoceras hygrometricum]